MGALALLASALLTERASLVRSREVGRFPLPASWPADRRNYDWISTNEVLYLARTGQGDYDAFVFDIRRATSRLLPGLDAVLKGHGVRNEWFEWTVSPNGRWLLVQAGPENNALRSTIRLDGSDRRLWARGDFYRRPAWRPDSRGWAELVTTSSGYARQILLYDIETGGLAEITVPAKRHATLVGFLAEDRLLVASQAEAGVFTDFEVLEIPNGTMSVGTPLHASVGTIETPIRQHSWSPTMARMAGWISMPSRLPRLKATSSFPLVGLERSFRTETCVFDPARGQVLRLGRIGGSPSAEGLSWTPDGSSVSWIEGAELCVLRLPNP